MRGETDHYRQRPLTKLARLTERKLALSLRDKIACRMEDATGVRAVMGAVPEISIPWKWRDVDYQWER